MFSDLRQVTRGSKIPTLKKLVTETHITLLHKRTILTAENLDPGFNKYFEGHNIHADDAAAKAAGFAGRVAAGAQSFSFLSEMLSLSFGMGWVRGGKIRVRFVRPLFIGEEISCGGEVKQVFPEKGVGAGRAKLEVWCKNSQGHILAIGTAEVRILLEPKD